MMTTLESNFKQTQAGMIPEDWDVSELGSIAEVVGGGTPPTSVKEYWEPSEIEWVTAKDISKSQTARIQTTEKRISKLGLENSSAKLLPGSTTVMIARGATMGQCRILSREMAMNQTCYGIVAKTNVDSVYLYYQLSNFYDRLRASAHGSVFDTVISSGLRSMEIPLPPTKEQQSTGKILFDLDLKIELNLQTNRTLEAIARAIFRRWFIDFEFPNDEGTPYKTSGGEMVYNEELDKRIPKDWKAGNILDIADLLNGGTPRTEVPEYWGGTIPWVSARDVTGSHGSFVLRTERSITYLGADNSSAKLLPKYTTVVTARGSVGSYCMLPREMAINQTNYGLKTKFEVGDFFVFFSISSLVNEMRQHSYGTIFDTITTTTFEEMGISIPPRGLITSFEELVGKLMVKILTNLEESNTLASIRDGLLPKLMSGKIRIPVEVG